MHRTEKAGLGAAYRSGFRVALDAGYDVIGEMDADGSHQPEQLHRLLDALEAGADLVIGSRWIPGGSIVNWPKSRELLSRGGNLYVRMLLGIDVHDATAGFRLFRRGHPRDDRHRHGAEHRLRLPDRHGLPHAEGRAAVVEVPIDFIERERGDSKMSRDVAVESLKTITRWGLRERARQVRRCSTGWGR